MNDSKAGNTRPFLIETLNRKGESRTWQATDANFSFGADVVKVWINGSLMFDRTTVASSQVAHSPTAGGAQKTASNSGPQIGDKVRVTDMTCRFYGQEGDIVGATYSPHGDPMWKIQFDYVTHVDLCDFLEHEFIVTYGIRTGHMSHSAPNMQNLPRPKFKKGDRVLSVSMGQRSGEFCEIIVDGVLGAGTQYRYSVQFDDGGWELISESGLKGVTTASSPALTGSPVLSSGRHYQVPDQHKREYGADFNKAPPKKAECTCTSRDLFAFGCKCGFMTR